MTWSIDGGWARCEALAIDGLSHGFGLRSTPAPSNLAVTLRQVHHNTVVQAEAAEDGIEADAVWERLDRLGERCLGVRTADCVPILLADPERRLVAAVHAGWRGIASRVLPEAIQAMASAGAERTSLIAAAGPSIGPCCYPVSQEVADQLEMGSAAPIAASGADLRGAIHNQLRLAGLRSGALHLAPWCTACESELFHSYRREGEAAGRQWSLIGPMGALP